MLTRTRLIVLVVLVVGAAVVTVAGDPPTTPVLDAMAAELGRSMELLSQQPMPPYFLSYEVTDQKTVTVSAQFGALTSSAEDRRRFLDIDLRVGSPALDNTREIRGERFGRFDDYSYAEVPIEDDAAALRGLLWYHTDRRFKAATQRLTMVKANVSVKVAAEDLSPDFSHQEPVTHAGELAELEVDRPLWEARLRTCTAAFARHAEIYQASAALRAERINRWYTNSEGTRIRDSRVAFQLRIYALTKAEDGMELPRFESFFAYTLGGLPDDEQLAATVEQMIADLDALRVAPVVEPYTGPAILSGRASGVFFHEIFGHRVEGHRQRRAEEAQTFRKKVGEPVLPADFSVIFDPTVRRIGHSDLAGAYLFDNEGVRGRPITVVDHGVLKGFLMSRTPVEGFPQSNGHGRREPGYGVVSRQSNLLVQTDHQVSHEQLRLKLIDMVLADGKDFGLLFDDIQGGFTFTRRRSPNAFNVIPVMVYRIFADGREELVRGVDLIGTPLTAFSRIVAADDRIEVFNGTCGAESGGVPVGAASPGILVSQIEVQKKAKSQERHPILPPPFSAPAQE